ncbi:hypothetical protein KFK09_012415 [Dendrobium nobile]|uniref:Uncharacterized protein n=1 Tax=Dendrobium nobile TaxID=94219 RepID=A0A8T3BH96_DENNO|nr:hypothetical protein KFK09_012415 [Dendrobium nobile]
MTSMNIFLSWEALDVLWIVLSAIMTIYSRCVRSMAGTFLFFVPHPLKDEDDGLFVVPMKSSINSTSVELLTCDASIYPEGSLSSKYIC